MLSQFPAQTTSESNLKPHLVLSLAFLGDKAITSLALDPGGARVLSGGIDYELKFWDFAGMDPSLRSFRGKKPVESHAINDLKYSSSGDKILVCGNLAQYKVLGRDGDELFESVSGLKNVPYFFQLDISSGER